MHVGLFHGALESIKQEYEYNGIVELLSGLQISLKQSISQPTPESATAFKENYTEISRILSSCKSNYATPTRRMIYDEIKATPNIGVGLLTKIKNIISANQVVPANALTEISVLAQELTTFITSINNIIHEFESLEIEYEILEPGSFEGGISIPRDIISPSLDDLAKEFSNIDTFIKTIKEIVGDDPTSVGVKTITLSEWQVFIELIPEAAACGALAIERIVALYKNHLEIKKLKVEMEEKKLPEAVIKPMQEYIDTIVKEKLREISEEVVDEHYAKDDPGRKNELKNKLTISLKYVAKRIDHGATFQIDAAPPKELKLEEGDENEVIPQDQIDKFNKIMELSTYVNDKNNEISELQRKEGPTLMLTDESRNPDDEAK